MTSDFSEDWQDLLPGLMTIREERLTKQLEEASKVAQQKVLDAIAETSKSELAKRLREEFPPGSPLTQENMAHMIALGVKLFMESWLETLKSSDLAGLIELVLEGQDLSPEEVKGFVRALPTSMIDRIVGSALGTASGAHALFALESHRRKGSLGKDYEILKLQNGRLAIQLPLEGDNMAVIHLNDEYHDVLMVPDR